MSRPALRFPRRILAALVCGGVCALVASEIFPVLSISFWRVAYAEDFAVSGYVGIGASPAPEWLLSSRIAAAPTAALSYRMMYALGNAQGKAYAVQGMRRVDWAEFERLRDDLALRPGTVSVRDGCLGSDETCEQTMLWLEDLWYGRTESRAQELARLRAHFEALRKQKAQKAD